MKTAKFKSLKYVDLRYTPDRNDVVAYYYLEPARNIRLEEAAEKVAGESSIDTWTTLSTMEPRIAEKLKPHVFEINRKANLVKIAYPSELFEGSSVPQILSSLAGNIFGMKAVKNLRLLDISFPRKVMRLYEGPSFGIKGIRRLLKVYNRPLLGTIVKPKVGLSAAKHAKVAYDAWVGGLDIVKDDENLTNQNFNKFKDRIEKTLKLRDKAERETGEKKIYMPNITAETFEMIKRADYVNQLGGEYVMVDIITVGFAALQTIRNHVSKRQVIHAHRAMHAALTRNPKHGVSMAMIAKFSRMIGVDQLHVGTMGVGKMNNEEDYYSYLTLVEDNVREQGLLLDQDWNSIKPVFPVASGGLHPGVIPELIKKFGKDVILQFGGGCHGHPKGTKIGAKVIRLVTEGIVEGKTLGQLRKSYSEVDEAIKKFGIKHVM